MLRITAETALLDLARALKSKIFQTFSLQSSIHVQYNEF